MAKRVVLLLLVVTSQLTNGFEVIDLVDKITTFGEQVFSRVAPRAQDAVNMVTTGVEKMIVKSTLKDCNPVKTWMGATYDALKSKVPDLSKLTFTTWKANKMMTKPFSEGPSTVMESRSLFAKEPVFIVLHGFMSTSTGAAPKKVTDALRKAGYSHVLAVDSSSLIKYFYFISSTSVRFVGEELGKMIAKLINQGVSPDDIHLIGHSLGAHIAGYAAKTFHDMTGEKVGRITALDPAGPCFYVKNATLKINKMDAQFLDVIHTDGGVFGLIDPIGHVDFYPNGGEQQPGCCMVPCSHNRSWQLFVESIANPKAFPAQKCAGWNTFLSDGCESKDHAYMGFAVDRSTRGKYYLKTRPNPPYSKN